MSKSNVLPSWVSFGEVLVQVPLRLGRQDCLEAAPRELPWRRETPGKPLEVPLSGWLRTCLWNRSCVSPWGNYQPDSRKTPYFPEVTVIYFSQGVLSSFCFRQAWFQVHSLFMRPCPEAVHEETMPLGAWLLMKHMLLCLTFECFLPWCCIFRCRNNKCGIKLT